MWRLKTFRLVVLGVVCCLIMQIFRSYDIPPSFTENVAKGPEPNEEDDAPSVTITEKLVKDTEPNEGNDAPSVTITEKLVKDTEPNEGNDAPSVTITEKLVKDTEPNEGNDAPSVTITEKSVKDTEPNEGNDAPSVTITEKLVKDTEPNEGNDAPSVTITEKLVKDTEPNEGNDAPSVTITEKLVKDTEPNEGNDAPSVTVTENVVKGKEPNEEDDPPSVTVTVNVTKEIELSEEDYTPSVTKTDPNEEDDQANPLDSPPSHVGEYQINEISESLDRKTISRRNVVKKMMKHAWDSYVKYAWGANELRPVSKTSHSSVYFSTRLGTTIVDGLDTLYLMGLTDEFTHGREWVAQNFQLDSRRRNLNVFESTIRLMGGLLSCFALTGDEMFRNKAEHLAKKLLPAFQTPTGIPHALVDTKTRASFNHEWVGERNSILSEIGSLSLEFGYLSDTTGDRVYYNKVDHVRRFLKSLHKPRGLYPTQLSPKTGEWGNDLISIGSYGDSFYEYLLKEWLRTGRKEDEVRQMYVEAMESIMNYILTTSAGGLMYFGEIINDEVQPRMDHLACYSGGLLALGAITLDNDTLSTKHLQVAEAITSTCHETYASTATKLGPDQFYFTDDVAQPIQATDKSYKLRPEVVESYFYMWRITKDPKYREWGWDVVQALNKHCRTSTGYSGITDVYSEETTMDDIQQSFFLAETLKYLYLLFSDDSLIPLSEWVFNTEGHPLPIKGNNCYFRAHNE